MSKANTLDVYVKALRSHFIGRQDCYLAGEQNSTWKEVSPLTDAVITNHLMGGRRIGIYADHHTSYLSFDFDGKNKEVGIAKALATALLVANAVGAGVLELTRSGNGYHLWLFFDPPYPTVATAKGLGRSILKSLNLPITEREKEGEPGIYPHAAGDVGKTCFLPLHGLLVGSRTNLFVDMLGNPVSDQLDALLRHPRVNLQELLERYPVVDDAGKRVRSVPTITRAFAKPRHDLIRDMSMQLRNYIPKATNELLMRSLAEHLKMEPEREKEIDRLITGAYATPALDVRTQFDIEQERGPEVFQLREADLDAYRKFETEIDYLIDGLVVSGETTILASPPGAGKSLISLSMAMAASVGQPVWGHFETAEPLRVLYVNEEMSEREFAKRYNKILAGLELNHDDVKENLRVLPQQGLILHPQRPAGLNAFKEKVLQFQPHLIFLDTFIALYGGEEKDAGEIRAWYNAVPVWLRQNMNSAVIVQHHVKKPPEDFSFLGCDDTTLLYAIRGSSDLPGAFERAIVLWKTKDEAHKNGRLVTIAVRNPKARSGDKFDNFDLTIDDVAIDATTIIGSKGIKSPAAAISDARIIHYLNEAGGKMDKTELLKLLSEHGSDRTARRWLKTASGRKVCYFRGDLVVKNDKN